MMVVGMSWFHWKLLGKRLIYMLEVFLGCQRILNPRGAQTFEKKSSQKKWEIQCKWKKDVYIVRDMKAVAQNELYFQKLSKHHPF